MSSPKLPTIILSVEAQPWPKEHVARIASLRTGCMKPATRKKIQSATIAR